MVYSKAGKLSNLPALLPLGFSMNCVHHMIAQAPYSSAFFPFPPGTPVDMSWLRTQKKSPPFGHLQSCSLTAPLPDPGASAAPSSRGIFCCDVDKWLAHRLFPHCRLRPLRSKAHWCQTKNFTHTIVLKIVQTCIFSHLKLACFTCPVKPHLDSHHLVKRPIAIIGPQVPAALQSSLTQRFLAEHVI